MSTNEPTMHVVTADAIPISDATIAKIEAWQADLDALLTPEAKARLDVAERELEQRVLGGR